MSIIGRMVKVLVDETRAEPFDNTGGCRTFPVSVFYPATEVSEEAENLLSLFRPAEDEAVRLFSEVEVSKDKLQQFRIPVVDNAPPHFKSGPLPVVIFSPGFGLDRDLYIEVITALVKAGYLVVTVGAPYDTIFTVFPDGRIVLQAESPSDKEDQTAALKTLITVRFADVQLVMKHLATWNEEDERVRGKFDLDRVGLVGHSLGGATVYHVAAADTPVRCVVLLDGSLHLLDSQKVAVPLLSMRQDAASYDEFLTLMHRDSESFPEVVDESKRQLARAFCDGQNQLYDDAQAIKSFVKVIGTEHMSFSTVGSLISDVHRDAIEAIQATTVAFLDEFLNGKLGSFSSFLQGVHRPVNVVEIDRDGNPVGRYVKPE